MSWTTIIGIALFGVGIAAVVIAIIENHRRVAPVIARWAFLAWIMFSGTLGSSAWDQWTDGRTGQAAISAVIATIMLCVSITMFRTRRRAESAASGSET